MNALSAAALSAVVACSLPLAAQQNVDAAQAATQESRTGVSTPPTALDNAPANSADSGVVPGYQPTPAANLVRREPVGATAYVPAEALAPRAVVPADDVRETNKADVDAGIVTSLSHAPDELPVGTTFKARMRETLSTASTESGAPFSAELVEAVEQDGRVVVPAGTLIEGKVTEVRGGRRIHGTASLHLEPMALVLPDGTRHVIRAQVIDTSESFATRIDAEGTIVRRDHIKQTLVGMGLATGGAIAAGAVLGGGVGALVGAGVGVGVSTAWWLKQDRQTVLPEETAVVFSLNEPVMMSARP